MRYVILAASNYIGTKSELKGCINDMKSMRAILDPTNPTYIADLRDSDMSTQNWQEALTEAVSKAVSGDVIYHAHSHHGTQIRDSSGNLHEVFCPNDFQFGTDLMVTDKWMHALLDNLKPGVKWIDHADCCHAADGLRTFWCQDESPKYIVNQNLDNKGFWGLSDRLKPMVVTGPDRHGILLAACRSDQTSADAYIDGMSCGAFTNSFLRALKTIPFGSYEDLMIKSTDYLRLGGYSQRPELNCIGGDQSGIFANDVLGSNYKSCQLW